MIASPSAVWRPIGIDAHPLGDRLEPVRLEIRMDHGGQQQRVQHGLREADAGDAFLEAQETHIERRVVRDQHGIHAELAERREHPVDRRLALEHRRLDDR